MAGYIKVEVGEIPTQALNMQINKDIFYEFKVKCKKQRLQMNVVIEVFMNQYTNGKYYLSKSDILKWKKDDSETETFNSTFNKEIYNNFKDVVKKEGLFVKHVIAAFVEDYVNSDLTMEFVRKENDIKMAKMDDIEIIETT